MNRNKGKITQLDPTPEESAEEPKGKVRPRLALPAFEASVAGLKENDVPNLYINRIKPQVKKENSGRPFNYIEKLNHPLPADLYGYIKKLHGGGEYQLMLNAANRQLTAVAECILEIPLAEADPILDFRELVRGKADTEQLIRRWKQEGKIGEDPDGSLFQIVQGQAPQQSSTAVSTPQILEKVVNTALASMLEGNKQPSTLDIISIVRQMQPPPPDNTMMTFIVQQLTAQQDQNRMLMQQLLDQKGQSRGEGDNLSNTITTLKTLGDTFGIQTAAGGQQHWAVQLFEAISKMAPPLLGAFMLAKGPLMESPAASPALPNPAADAAQPPPMDPRLAEIRRLAMRVLDAIDKERPGDEFAMSLVDMMGQQVYDQLASAGVETLNTTLRMFPDLAAQFDQRADKLATFLAEFVNAFKEATDVAA
jgi:hypothetical protein